MVTFPLSCSDGEAGMCVNGWGIPALPAEPAPCSGCQGNGDAATPGEEIPAVHFFPRCLFPKDCVRFEARSLRGCESVCQEKGVCCVSGGSSPAEVLFPRSRLDPALGTSLSERRRWERQRVSSLLHRAGAAFGNGSVAPGDSDWWEKA